MCGHAWHDRMPVVGAPGAMIAVSSNVCVIVYWKANKDILFLFVVSL